jgi:NAD(P)-dependent dehydrogenase (short-subunit alcohol dehydrogenase family)
VKRWGGAAALAAAAGAGALAVSRGRRADLHGKIAVVTGGGRGLGLLIARELAGQGCRLALCGRTLATVRRAAAELERPGVEVLAVDCDVSDQDECERLVARVVDRYGRLDILVNNAGVIQVGPLRSMRVEDFREALGAMFWGPVYLTLAAVPIMRERGWGRIANISSVGGAVPFPHLVPYACAKAAVLALSEGSRAELRRDGVAVTTVVPGLMRTGSNLHARFAGRAEREFGWFSALAGLPVLSMDAERAARRIVDAVRRGRPEVVLSPAAQLAVRAHGLAPNLTARALAVADRMLPEAPAATGGRGLPGPAGLGAPAAPAGDGPVTGEQARAHLRSPLLDRLTTLNRRAARRFGQVGGRDGGGHGA